MNSITEFIWIRLATEVAEKQPELEILDILEAEPEITQADLAARVGVAVGTVNWYLKRWTAKGFVKVRRIGRWRWRYLVTPRGIAEKTRLAAEYMEASFAVYRQTRAEATRLLLEVKAAGSAKIRIEGGNGDIAEIVKLTGLELGIKVVDESTDGDCPVLEVRGKNLALL